MHSTITIDRKGVPMVGIDLGTTNSVVAYINGDGEAEIIVNVDEARVTPSVILFEGDNVTVGQTAKDNTIFDPLNTVQFVKRQMDNPEYVFVSDSGKNYSAEAYLGQVVTEAVVTVPAYFSGLQRGNDPDDPYESNF